MDISSPNNVKLMEAVVKAAEDLETAIACGDPILSAARARLRAAVQIFRDHNTLAALNAHTEAPQETVTLAVWVYPEDGSAMMFVAGGNEDRRSTPPWRRLGTVTLPLNPEVGR